MGAEKAKVFGVNEALKRTFLMARSATQTGSPIASNRFSWEA
jgi:hypothetical protein